MTELEYWTNQIVRGRISRREFMGRAAALGVGTAMATVLLSRAGVAQEGKKGGSARIGLAHGATTDSLDPGTYPDTFTQVSFWGAMSNSLTDVDQHGNIVLDLAESVEPADGAKKWVVKLRPGLTFHNGKTVTSDDVVASFRHHMGADSKSAAKTVLAEVSDIQTDGPETVIFTLNAGNADFPFILSDYHIPIMPSADGVADWQSGVRTGPFILETFEPGVRTKLNRNPNYHKTGLPYFDDVEILALTDVTARTNALMTGEIHWMGRCDLKTLHLLQRNPQVAITEITGYGHYTLPMDVRVPPFDNVDVRQALKYAIDRQDIAAKVFLGHATAGNDNPIPPPPSVKYAINPEPVHVYDPEKVKFHLDKAGLSSLAVDLSVADAAFAGAVDAAVLYQDSAARAGITINVVREPNDGYWDNVWLKKPWCASYWGGRPTIDWMVSTVYADGAAWNETHWSNPRFNELMVAARGETDEDKRAGMYAEMQQLIHDDCGALVMVFNNYVDAHSTTVAHGDIASNWEVDGFRLPERWWFA
jgi:peptide/nickel transport system substrate-binding protein